MGLFGLGKKESTASPTTTLNLEKSTLNLEKSLNTIKMTKGVDLNTQPARVGVVVDFSGSMRELYRSGAVQTALNRLMPLALKFDDNGELDVWLFHNEFKRMESMTVSNIDGYVQNVLLAKGGSMGGTSYAPVLKDCLKKYFSEDTAKEPVFLIFITDGANDDKNNTTTVVIESSNQNIFIQFVGIGNADFPYLEKLDDLPKRVVDNTGFIKVSDMAAMDEVQLYNLLLDQYPDWLRAKPF